MNDRQHTALRIAAVLAGVMLLFPPTRTEAFYPPWMNEGNEEVEAVSAPIRYQLIFSDDFSFDGKGTYLARGIHWGKLRLQLMVLTLAVIFMLVLLRGREDDSSGAGGDGQSPETSPPVSSPPHAGAHVSV